MSQLAATFNETDFAFLKRGGTALLLGQAFMRRRDGGIVTAGGEPILLWPSSPHVDEWIERRFLNNERVDPDPRIDSYGQAVRADANGNFGFDQLSAGTYWLLTQVLWQAGFLGQQGGTLLQKVTLSEGQTLRIVLTR